jgi:pSer/pThr/pTyr-binding forkhead associated (FHA) protein
MDVSTAPAMLLLDERRVELGPEGLTIGREPDNDLVLESHRVSRYHAAVRRRAEGFELVDLGSTNGTWYHGRRTVRARVQPGDELVLGECPVVLEAPAGIPSQAI